MQALASRNAATPPLRNENLESDCKRRIVAASREIGLAPGFKRIKSDQA